MINPKDSNHVMDKILKESMDGEVPPEVEARARQHLANLRRRMGQLESRRKKSVVTKGIAEIKKPSQQESKILGTVRRKFWRPALVAAAALLLMAIMSVGYWLGQKSGPAPLSAFSVLAQAAEVMSGLRSVHIKANMRTIAHDNFELIGVEYDFVPHEIWKEFSDPPRWRVEKPGRVVVMDGKSSLMLIQPGYPYDGPKVAYEGSPKSGFVGWLKPLLEPDRLLDREVRLALEQDSTLLLTHEMGADGAHQIVITVEAKAQGDFSQSDASRNTSISEADNMRIYTFDANNHRLEDLEVYVKTEDGDVLVFDITQIDYDVPLDPTLFALEVPDDALQFDIAQLLTGAKGTAEMTPKEAARAFFQALVDEKWDVVQGFYPVLALHPLDRKQLGGLEIISIGEPFKSGRFPGWFVPYEIRCRTDSNTRKHNLALKKAPNGNWRVSGGL